MTRFILYFTCLLLIGCTTKQVPIIQTDPKLYKVVDFCDLPKYEGDLVYVIGTYSGVEEYWSFNPANKGGCSHRFNMDLGLGEEKHPKPEFDDSFRQAATNYFDTYLVVEAIGTYSDELKEYGHLGTNNSVFVVHELIKVTVKKKKRL